MENILQELLQWMVDNIAFIVAAFLIFFEITPIKISPLSSLLHWIGKKITSQVMEQLEVIKKAHDEDTKQIKDRLDKQQLQIDEQSIARIRHAILGFADELRSGRSASKEKFDHIMSEDKTYEELIVKHGLQNAVYEQSFNFIRQKYHDCLVNNSFAK